MKTEVNIIPENKKDYLKVISRENIKASKYKRTLDWHIWL